MKKTVDLLGAAILRRAKRQSEHERSSRKGVNKAFRDRVLYFYTDTRRLVGRLWLVGG
jgi:hypothetical protein